MSIRAIRRTLVVAALATSAGASPAPVVGGASAAERAVAPEKNPPGDIPDTQVFIDYRSSLGFSMKVPEGWARSDLPDGARFVDKFDAVEVTVSRAATAPTIESVKATIAPEMKAKGRAVSVTQVEAVKLPGGDAIRIVYSANSEPDPVVNKQVRLEGDRYLYFSGSRLATLDLTVPFGADNADQWRLMSQSFRWR